jgi:DNA-binding response OmpR family regulator
MHILIVEDEAPDMAHLKQLLGDIAPEAAVHEATTRLEALSSIQKTGFDLAIVDLSLHGDRHAGAEVIKALRTKGDTAVVVISGLDVVTFRPLVFELGVWDYFQKPMDSGSLRPLLKRIAEAGDQKHLQERTNVSIPGLTWTHVLDNPTWQGHEVHLSVSEKKILLELLRVPDQVVPRSTLYDLSPNWGNDPNRLRHALTTMVSEIRKAFKEHDLTFDRIVSAGSIGYVWRIQAAG